MATTLSQAQCEALADAWTGYAAALSDYQSDHLGDEDIDGNQLGMWVVAAAAKADNFSRSVLSAGFDDVDAAFRALKNVIGQASQYTARQKGAVQTWNGFAKIAAAMFNLADACAGTPLKILDSAVEVARSYTRDPRAKPAGGIPGHT